MMVNEALAIFAAASPAALHAALDHLESESPGATARVEATFEILAKR